ncbi:hypothetical protein D9756_005192 [Leucocoprinus leucothites]|uniref:Uncharacterized protein n=1 Tax=Leucocoprinus leucothites TaxID=201217 RepID=A0A8H5G9F3_9AGAR|nr:hypothetical protein D9756_005192 [Leucoagaricus leucothites]
MKSTYILVTFFALVSGGAFAQSLENCSALTDPSGPDAAYTLDSMEGTCNDDALCADGCNNELLDEGLCLLNDCYCFNAQPVDNDAQKCSEVTSEEDPFGSCSLDAM